jgi:hypothetical protein
LAAAVNVTDMDADVVVNNAKPFEDVPPDTLPAVITIDIRDDGTPNDAAMIIRRYVANAANNVAAVVDATLIVVVKTIEDAIAPFETIQVSLDEEDDEVI